MDKKRLATAAILIIAGGILAVKAQSLSSNNSDLKQGQDHKSKKILYFNPQVYPNLEEIKEPTNSVFFSTVSDKVSSLRNNKMLRADSPIDFDNIDIEAIKDYCLNNNADYAIVPKVKYFKVGFGKYVFSNQVVVSMKLYDAAGNFITETSYDTYKKNMRILGNAENSVKVGTLGAMEEIIKNLKKSRRSKDNSF